MSLEQITQPIRTESLEEHEQILDDKILEIQLEYIDRLLSEKIPPVKKSQQDSVSNLESHIEEYTTLLQELVRCYKFQIIKSGEKWDPETMSGPAEVNFKEKIQEFYRENHNQWIRKTMQFLEEERRKTKQGTDDNLKTQISPEEEYEEKENKAGILSFGVSPLGENYEELVGSGISKEDACISIHLTPLFKTTATSDATNLFSSHSLEKLAEQIVDKYPETKAIVAKSWLVDTPIAKRIGFTALYEGKYVGTYQFWGQFIGSNGQIDHSRVKQFLETGKPPYGVKTGVIMTEDFLKKYLPKERRGKILLKELKPGFIEKYEHDVEILRGISENWDTVTEDDIKNSFSKCPVVQDFMKSFVPFGGNGEAFLNLMLELKREKKTKEEVANDPRVNVNVVSWDTFINRNKFIKKEVVIE